MTVAAIVLAAGRSRRMGEANKLLLPLAGRPLVAWAVEAATASRAAPILVITGYQAKAVEAALAGCPVHFARNPDEGGDISSSLRLGLEALAPDVKGALICLGDMPGVTTAHLDALIAAFVGEGDICAPTHDGRRGNPVLWGRHHFPALMAVAGDIGGRDLLRGQAVTEIPVADDGILRDIDDPQAFAQWVKLQRNQAVPTDGPA